MVSASVLHPFESRSRKALTQSVDAKRRSRSVNAGRTFDSVASGHYAQRDQLPAKPSPAETLGGRWHTGYHMRLAGVQCAIVAAPVLRPAEENPCGAVAQLGERCVRNAEVRSSILLSSTNPNRQHTRCQCPTPWLMEARRK